MTDTTRPAPVSRGIRIALAVSLTLNLLVAGLVIGAWVGHDRDGRPDTALADIGFGPFIAALPGDERKAFGEALVARAGSLRENRQEFRAQFDTLLAALRAEPFDIAAVQAAVEASQSRLQERQEIGKTLIFGRIEAMSADERRAFADALERGLRHGPKFHRDPPPRRE